MRHFRSRLENHVGVGSLASEFLVDVYLREVRPDLVDVPPTHPAADFCPALPVIR